MDHSTGLFSICRRLLKFSSLFPDWVALFKPHIIAETVAPYRYLHISGSVLCRAGTQSVQSECKSVIAAGRVIVVFPTGIEFAEHQLPVPAVFPGVPVQRASAAEILHFDGTVRIVRQCDQVSVAFSRFINGIGKDFKYGVFTAVQAVRTENDSGTQPDTIRPLQLGNAFIAVFR